MKLYKQESKNENGTTILKNLIKILKIPVSETSIDEVKKLPDYPSLAGLSDALTEWNVENLAVKLTMDQLKDIPVPSIAHLNSNKGHYVIITRFEDGHIEYEDPLLGFVRATTSAFEKEWTGYLLLIQASTLSGERDYYKKRNTERLNSFTFAFSSAVLGIIAIVPFLSISPFDFPYYILKLLGLAICVVLFQREIGKNSKFATALCSLGTKTNCDAVIASSYSKVMGIFSLAELGMLYFSSSILIILLAGVAHRPPAFDYSLSIFILPVSFLSIYYQWKIKIWCPLCLGVVGILWLQAILLIPEISIPRFQKEDLIVGFVGYGMPFTAWLLVRKVILEWNQIPLMQSSLNRFVQSEKIFRSALTNQPNADISTFSHEITSGDPNAPIILTVVSNPNCGPCATAHHAIEEVLRRFEGKVRVKFRFMFDRENPDSSNSEMVRHVLAKSLTQPESSLTTISDWFLKNGRADIVTWKANNPLVTSTTEKDQLEKIIDEHLDWARKTNIRFTPTIFINDKQYPEEYGISDLHIQIKNLLKPPSGACLQ